MQNTTQRDANLADILFTTTFIGAISKLTHTLTWYCGLKLMPSDWWVTNSFTSKGAFIFFFT